MSHVTPEPLTAAGFAAFGRVHDLGVDGPDVRLTKGPDWLDGFTLPPLIDGRGHLGMTRAPAAPWTCRQMERHPLTEEALFCAGAPIVLAVAPPSAADAPDAAAIRAFVIQPGQVAVMNRNVWHDACRGLDGPAAYYWMAICGLGPDPWVAPDAGPVEVRP
ncbi:ureidoglycolate lyase [Paracoccus sp. PAR01]|uniref:ureidoglycolate lyase n=1 Tax=Paracoccus sp. PAR01 TaxID=2769282 RepID=UPI001782F7B7|nr:ureidoglycolate lyase [Paracoccus sp. PAR01]MBD9529929.1 ureidoglycolate lyase [Paracoccus sp. PAR01]